MSTTNNTLAGILGGAGYRSEGQPLWRDRGRGWGTGGFRRRSLGGKPSAVKGHTRHEGPRLVPSEGEGRMFSEGFDTDKGHVH